MHRFTHRILDPKAGPLIAVKLRILTRKAVDRSAAGALA
jgi:predicted oxidoreductase